MAPFCGVSFSGYTDATVKGCIAYCLSLFLIEVLGKLVLQIALRYVLYQALGGVHSSPQGLLITKWLCLRWSFLKAV